MSESREKKKALEAERQLRLDALRKKYEEMDEQMAHLIDQARRHLEWIEMLQNRLIPTEIPYIKGGEMSAKFIPSFLSGGDYYDVFKGAHSNMGLVLSTCSSSITSSLLMQLIFKHAVETSNKTIFQPHEAVTAFCQNLESSLGTGQTVELFYGLLDKRSMKLRYSSIGGVVAFYDSRHHGGVKRLSSQGPPLVGGKPSYLALETQILDMYGGDRLILCSSGICESRNQGGEAFGEGRIKEAIQEMSGKGVHEIKNNILFKLECFMDGKEAEKDQTVVVVHLKNSILKLIENSMSYFKPSR